MNMCILRIANDHRVQRIEVGVLRRRAVRWIAAGAALFLTACFTTPTPAPPVEWLNYRIGPPDQLKITILPEPIVVEAATVRPDGMITVQLIGDVPAGNRTTLEVADDIQQRITRYKRGAVVTVSLTTAAADLITVYGEVNRPQTMPLTRQMRVSEALGTAGDITNLANKDKIRVVRPGNPTEVIIVDIAAIRTGDLSTNVQLYGGDIVYVEPTFIAKIGYVMRQFLFPFDPIFNAGRNVARL
jgi:polysaccharide export outer membrane protein